MWRMDCNAEKEMERIVRGSSIIQLKEERIRVVVVEKGRTRVQAVFRK